MKGEAPQTVLQGLAPYALAKTDTVRLACLGAWDAFLSSHPSSSTLQSVPSVLESGL